MGPETWLKEELFGRLAEQVTGEANGMNVSRFRLPSADVADVVGTCLSLPMLTEKRVVLVTDVDRAPKDKQPLLLEYVAKPAPEAVLVLASERYRGDALHRDLIRAGAAAATFETPTPEQSAQWIRIRFRDLDKEIDAETAAELYRRCGGGTGEAVSLRAMAPEIEKVALHVGERRDVAEDDLQVIGRKAEEDLLWQVLSCVSRRDLEGALGALDGALLFRENTEVRVVASLAYRILDLLGARGRVEGGDPPAKALSGVWPRVRSEYEAGLRRYDLPTLERALAALADADRVLKSSPKNPRIVLEETIIKICTT